MERLKLSTKTLLVIAVIMLVILLAGPLGYKFGLTPLRESLMSLLVAAAGGALTALACIYFLVRAQRASKVLDRNLVLLAIVLALLPVLIVVPQVMASRSVPPIHDITTDTREPPAFSALLEARRRAPNGADYGASPGWPASKLREAQQAAYPHIQPIMTSLSMTEAAARAEAVLQEMGLEVVDVNLAVGRVEATATTFWYGFKDDVVVRVRRVQGGSRLDVRSMSRIGRSDLGANAARIAEFTARYQ